jgi:hypothetical protein
MWCKPKTTTIHKRKKRGIHVSTALFLLVLLFLAIVQAQNATGQNFQVLIPTNGKLTFQNDIGKTVTLQIISGTLNSTNNRLTLNSGGGRFYFSPNQTVKIKITYTVDLVKVSGDQNNALREISSGTTITANAANKVNIIWDLTLAPTVPIMFVFGMFGLGALIGGPMYIVYKLKHRDYYEGLVTGILITVVGYAFLYAWLAS